MEMVKHGARVPEAMTARSPNLSVGLVVRQDDGQSGLSRYADALYRELRTQPTISPVLLPVAIPASARFLARLLRPAGLDLVAFLRLYPVHWPPAARRCDLIHLTHRSQATLLLRKIDRPVVVTVHDIIHYQHRANPDMHIYRHPIQKWFDIAAVRLLRRADALLASSEYTRRILLRELELEERQVHTVHLAVDHETFRPQPVPPAFYERYRLSPGVPYVLHVGTEEARKNVDVLLRAFARVLVHHPEARLLRVGKPRYPARRARLLDLAAGLELGDRVSFIDDVTDEDLVHFYNAATVFVFPSLAEGFGLPVLEAMACGTPVIHSGVTSLPELTNGAAAVVPPDDWQGLATAISRLLSGEQRRRRCACRGIEQANSFTWSTTAEATVALYRALAAEEVPGAR